MKARILVPTPGCWLAVAALAQPGGKTFVFSNAARNLEEFRDFAKAASVMKVHGRVQIDIGVLADKSWHEYASYVSTPAKFFPHPKIAPHFPAEWVARFV